MARYGVGGTLNYNQRRSSYESQRGKASRIEAELRDFVTVGRTTEEITSDLKGRIEALESALKGCFEALESALNSADRTNQEGMAEPPLRDELSADISRAYDLYFESRRQVAELTDALEDLEAKLAGVNVRLEAHDRYKSEAERTIKRLRGKLERSESKLSTIENSRSWQLVRRYWALRDRRGDTRKPEPTPESPTEPTSGIALADSAGHLDVSNDDEHREERDQLEELKAGVESWLAAAEASNGPEVVLMFSGTTSYQFRRINRPIRLTKVFLDQGCPVFFNYYRFAMGDLPEPVNDILMQSPIDMSAELLPQILKHDYGAKEKLLFVSFPHEMMVRNMLAAAQHGWKIIYDVRDDWEEFAQAGAARWYQPEYEWYVATHADLVTAVSLPLASKIEVLADRPIAVNPNALDPDFPRSRKLPTEIPIVGYFGHLADKWFDWSLLLEAAAAWPEYKFELAGHQAPALALPDNVKLLGLLSHEEIALASSRWSAAIIPFKTSPLSDGLDPIEIYEYLHLGLPTVTTFFPQLMHYPGVRVCESRSAFVDGIGEAVEEAGQGAVDNADWLLGHTWKARVDAYRDALRNAGTGASVGSSLIGRSS